MITICYIIGQLGRGGTEKQLYELLRGLNREIFHPFVISLSTGGIWADKIRRLGIDVIEIERKKNMEIKRLSQLIKLLRHIKPKIVHTFLFSANSYGRIAAIICRVPIIIASERNLPEIGKDKTAYQIYIDRFLSLFSDAIICNSMKASITLRRYAFNGNKLYTVYNGIRTDNYVYISRVMTERKIPVIGTVCRLSPQKNIKLFIDMAHSLLKQGYDLKFMIIGDGPDRRNLENYAQSLGIRNRILFTGDQSDVRKFLSNMDIFVLTSSYEGMSNALMEAMATGLPVIASNVGGNSELIIDGKTGYLFQSNNLGQLVEKVAYLLNYPDSAKDLGEQGRERIINDFSADKMVENTVTIYLRLLESKMISFN